MLKSLKEPHLTAPVIVLSDEEKDLLEMKPFDTTERPVVPDEKFETVLEMVLEEVLVSNEETPHVIAILMRAHELGTAAISSTVIQAYMKAHSPVHHKVLIDWYDAMKAKGCIVGAAETAPFESIFYLIHRLYAIVCNVGHYPPTATPETIELRNAAHSHVIGSKSLLGPHLVAFSTTFATLLGGKKSTSNTSVVRVLDGHYGEDYSTHAMHTTILLNKGRLITKQFLKHLHDREADSLLSQVINRIHASDMPAQSLKLYLATAMLQKPCADYWRAFNRTSSTKIPMTDLVNSFTNCFAHVGAMVPALAVLLRSFGVEDTDQYHSESLDTVVTSVGQIVRVTTEYAQYTADDGWTPIKRDGNPLPIAFVEGCGETDPDTLEAIRAWIEATRDITHGIYLTLLNTMRQGTHMKPSMLTSLVRLNYEFLSQFCSALDHHVAVSRCISAALQATIKTLLTSTDPACYISAPDEFANIFTINPVMCATSALVLSTHGSDATATLLGIDKLKIKAMLPEGITDTYAATIKGLFAVKTQAIPIEQQLWRSPIKTQSETQKSEIPSVADIKRDTKDRGCNVLDEGRGLWTATLVSGLSAGDSHEGVSPVLDGLSIKTVGSDNRGFRVLVELLFPSETPTVSSSDRQLCERFRVFNSGPGMSVWFQPYAMILAFALNASRCDANTKVGGVEFTIGLNETARCVLAHSREKLGELSSSSAVHSVMLLLNNAALNATNIATLNARSMLERVATKKSGHKKPSVLPQPFCQKRRVIPATPKGIVCDMATPSPRTQGAATSLALLSNHLVDNDEDSPPFHLPLTSHVDRTTDNLSFPSPPLINDADDTTDTTDSLEVDLAEGSSRSRSPESDLMDTEELEACFEEPVSLLENHSKSVIKDSNCSKDSRRRTASGLSDRKRKRDAKPMRHNMMGR